jgi:hypothetical protein
MSISACLLTNIDSVTHVTKTFQVLISYELLSTFVLITLRNLCHCFSV